MDGISYTNNRHTQQPLPEYQYSLKPSVLTEQYSLIATVTSDGTTGTFGYSWTPTTPGIYEIYAVFAGTDAYAYSTASTYATVVSAPTPTTTPTPSSTPTPTNTPVSNLATNADLMTYIVVAAIAIIIAIAVATLLLLRKRT